jgi:pteridine reductase
MTRSRKLQSVKNSAPVALVTGGARRVGRAIGLTLANSGYDVAFTYNNSASDAKSLVRQIDRIGRRALMIQADLTDPDSASQVIFDAVQQTFGKLNVLVNNASTFAPGRLHETDLPLVHTVVTVHMQSPLLLCQRFEKMLRASRGHVVNMVDLLAERPWPEYLIYCASKAALWNLTLSLARELAPDVTVNGIAPGVVDWPDDYPDSEKEKYLKRVPLNRAGTPEDIANLVRYLVTGGNYITGQIIRVDGGRSIT